MGISDPVSSVTQDIFNAFWNGADLEVFIQNGYIIMKLVDRDDLVLLYDPETGIMRDINTANGYCGAYCFHDTLIYQSYALGGNLNQEKKQFNWKKAVYWACIIGGIAVGVAAAVLFAPAGAPILYYSLVAAGAVFGFGSAYFGDLCYDEG